MDKKTCVITGATSGIGYGVARALARKGAKLVLIGRDASKGHAAVNQLKREFNNPEINFHTIDLCSQRQIRKTGEEIKKLYPQINVLINNAGIWTSRLELTENAIEKQFAVNHLAYFLLTHILYPNLAVTEDARIINVGSDSHKYGRINFDNINLKNEYHGLKAYGQSKLANLLFTYELERLKKEPHVSTYCVSPGLVKTDIGVKHTNPFHGFMWKLRRLSGKTPDKAAETVVYLALSDEVTGKSGLYWEKCNPKTSSRDSYNKGNARRLWKISEELCDIRNYFP